MEEIIHSMGIDQDKCKMVCGGMIKSGGPCKRFIVGSQCDYNFEHVKLGNCDMRESWWYCYQHFPNSSQERR